MALQATSRSVGRPREFDKEAVLAAAMDAFWAKGYEATSMADLCAATGLHKGSLYQAFGDKHRLFMAALDHYSESEFREVAAVAFLSDSPLKNIRAAVSKICEDACHEKGCLMVNTLVELAPHDAEVKEALRSFSSKRLRVIANLIGKAQQLGEIRDTRAPEKMARQLMVTMAGGAAMAKGFLDPAEISEVMSELIDSWV